MSAATVLAVFLAGAGCHAGRRAAAPLAPVLPKGTLAASWEATLNDSYAFGYDRKSRTLEISSVDLNGQPMVGAIDAASGRPRWTSNSLGGSWATQEVEPRSPVVTWSGIGFVSQPKAYNREGPAPLTAVRLSDGKALWRLPAMAGMQVVQGNLVGSTGSALDSVDPASGVLRWRWPQPSDCANPSVVPTVQAVVLVRCDARLVAIRPSDGEDSWTWRPGKGCVIQDSAADDDVLAVTATCGSTAEVTLVDPTTGAPLGDRLVPWEPASAAPDDPSRGAPTVQVSDGIVVVDGAQTVTVLTRQGKVLQTVHEARCETRPCVLMSNHGIVLALHHGSTAIEGSTEIESIDPATGRVHWQRPISAHVMALEQGLIYATGMLPDPLWSSTMTVIDPADGASHQVATLHDTVQLVDVDTGTMYLTFDSPAPSDPGFAAGAFRFVGDAPGLLGGADAERWPDACQLVTTQQLASLKPKLSYTPVARHAALSGRDLPHPPLCTFSPSDVTQPVITVSMIWVAADAGQATHVAAEYAKSADTIPLPGLTAYRMKAGTDQDGRQNVRTVLAAGHCVIDIAAPGDTDLSASVATLVARQIGSAPTAQLCRA